MQMKLQTLNIFKFLDLICILQKQGPSNALGYVLRDVQSRNRKGSMYTLHDIGLAIEKLMGGAYRLV
jgi:hypothetical protein